MASDLARYILPMGLGWNRVKIKGNPDGYFHERRCFLAVKLVNPHHVSTDILKSAPRDLQLFLEGASNILEGKREQLQLAWCCIVAGGHLLIEDLPGMGKTTMVKTIAKLLNLPWKRIQCTSDMLPADITGGSVYDQSSKEFVFIRGPIFSNLVMADELNRASPKSQSAFLQAMEENAVTVDGQTYDLAKPFVVIATQNSLDSAGTNPLPESQLDRFSMSLSLGLPARDIEKKLLVSKSRSDLLETISPMSSLTRLAELRKAAADVYVGEQVADYILDFAEWLRSRAHGISHRTILSLTACSRAWALGMGRDFVTPSDVQAVAMNVLIHRIAPKGTYESATAKALIVTALQSVEVDE